MNTQININRRLVLPISVLLTMLWLPLTTYAHDITKPAGLLNLQDCEQSTEILPASTDLISRAFNEGFGFSETDPADQTFQHIAVASRLPVNLQNQIDIGFSETDPANELLENIMTVTQSFSISKYVNAGFSETDPAANMYKSVGETDQHILADCHHEHAKSMVLQAPEFSSLNIKDSHHDFA